MHLPLPLLLLLPSAHAITIAFVYAGPQNIIQHCASSTPSHSLCCTPLDLNLNDGRGYGWFRAAIVTFALLPSSDSFTAVYRRSRAGFMLPCTGEMLTHKIGGNDWHTDVLPLGGAGSALATTGSGVERGWDTVFPVQVFWDGVAYTVDYRAVDGTFWYKNRLGGIIYGRAPLVRGGRGREGGLVEGKGRNESADVRAEE